MKFKLSKKIILLLCSLVFLMFSILSIRDTYARYVTSLIAKSYVELGSWLLKVNNQNIVENSDFSTTITPYFNVDSEYITEGKIAPASTGYFDILIDYSDVNVSFAYSISITQDASEAYMEDYKLVSYVVDTSRYDSVPATITGSITPNGVKTTQSLRFNFEWIEGTDEESDDIEDTKFAYDYDNLKWKIDISFTQIR